jgi:3-hydroxybutyryl-CoA dehydrogenase
VEFDANRPDLLIGVIGAGAMGRGIAQVAASGGIRVRLTDAKPGAAQDAVKFIESMLRRAAEKGSIKAEDAKSAIERIQVVDGPADMKPCHAVIEAIVENPEIKQKLFAELESIVSDDCIIASNTSSLSVTLLANKLKHPGRFAGFHFFNPVPLMRLVEVIDGLLTEPWVGEALTAIGKRMTREPVRVKDAPGFLVNQVGRGYSLEASHLVSEGVSNFVDVDRVMRDVGGFRMGPFELMDLTALDVTQPASELLYTQFFHETRYRPSLVMRSRLDAGILGRKTKRGFYDYSSGEQAVPAQATAPSARPQSVWVSKAEASGHASLTQLLDKLGAPVETGSRPSSGALILVTPLGEDTTTCALEQGLDPKRTVAVDTLFPMVKRRTIMTCPITAPEYREAAHGLVASDAVPVVVTRDSPGFIAQRIIAMIVNIGCSVAQNQTASPADIDKAVTLGLNYPHGPLAYGDRLGADKILKVLTNMQRVYGDQRYRPTLWLSRRARLGVSLLTPDN